MVAENNLLRTVVTLLRPYCTYSGLKGKNINITHRGTACSSTSMTSPCCALVVRLLTLQFGRKPQSPRATEILSFFRHVPLKVGITAVSHATMHGVGFQRRAEIKSARCHYPQVCSRRCFFPAGQARNWQLTIFRTWERRWPRSTCQGVCSRFPRAVCNASDIWIILGVTSPLQR